MFFQQYVLGCLSQLSYLVGDESTGRAVVVDPHREMSVQPGPDRPSGAGDVTKVLGVYVGKNAGHG